MSAMEPLCSIIGVQPRLVSKEEIVILEAEIFTHICYELKELQRKHNKEFFQLMKFTPEVEDFMLEKDFLHFVIKDILSSGEYNLEGIAYYTNTPEDVVMEVACGENKNPSAIFLRKIIELHRNIRKNFYENIMKKIITAHC